MFVEGKIEKVWSLDQHGGSSGFKIGNQSYRGSVYLQDRLSKVDLAKVGIIDPDKKELYKGTFVLEYNGQEVVSFNHEVGLRLTFSKFLGWGSIIFLMMAILLSIYVYRYRTKE